MLNYFVNEFLYENYVSDEDCELIDITYKDSILRHKSYNDNNIFHSKLKTDYKGYIEMDYTLCEDIIVKYIRKFITEHSLDKDGDNYEVDVDPFFNYYEKVGDYMEAHNHDHSDLSMIYFLTDSPSPTNFFPSNYFMNHLSNKLTVFKKTSNPYSIYPKKGKYLIFTPNTYHSVPPLETNHDRITFVSNIGLKRIDRDENYKTKHYFK